MLKKSYEAKVNSDELTSPNFTEWQLARFYSEDPANTPVFVLSSYRKTILIAEKFPSQKQAENINKYFERRNQHKIKGTALLVFGALTKSEKGVYPFEQVLANVSVFNRFAQICGDEHSKSVLDSLYNWAFVKPQTNKEGLIGLTDGDEFPRLNTPLKLFSPEIDFHTLYQGIESLFTLKATSKEDVLVEVGSALRANFPEYLKEILRVLLEYEYLRAVNDKVLLDMSEEKQETLMKAMFYSSPRGVIITDTNARILFANDEGYRRLSLHFGTNVQVGDVIGGVGDKDLAARFKERFLRTSKGQSFTATDTFVRNGVKHWFLYDFNPVFQATGFDGIFVRISDVTASRELEKEKRKRERQINALANSLPGVVFQAYVKHDGRSGYKYISPQVEKYFGLKAADVLINGRLIDNLATDVEGYLSSIRESITKRKDWIYEGSFDLPNIGRRWLLGMANLSFRNKNHLSYDGFFLDVTETVNMREALKKERERLHSISETIPGVLFEIEETNHKDYTISYVSNGAKNIFGLEPELIANNPDLESSIKKIFISPFKEGKLEAETSYTLANGQKVWLHTRVNPALENGEGIRITRWKGLISDITELVQSKQAAEAALKAKTQFLSAVSHEMRTPLNAIIGLNEVIKKEVDSPSALQHLGTLEFCANNLLETINKLLDFSKVEAGKFVVVNKPTDLKQLLEKVTEVHRFQAERKGLNFLANIDSALPEIVLIDENALTSVLNNLLSNAVKFTEDGFVVLEINKSVTTGKQHHVTIRVSDTGAGIPPQKILSIFNQYEQVDNHRDHKKGGTGLGLSIARDIVRSMGGELEVSSELGKGTSFWFSISINEASNLTQELTPHTMPSPLMLRKLEGLEVLLAEDNDINSFLFQDYLAPYKVALTIVSNGLEAVEICRQRAFDVILMDIQMPVLDGIKASKHIRQIPQKWVKDVAIVALTAFALEETANEASLSGMNDYLLKPFRPEQLITMVLDWAFKPKVEPAEQPTLNSFLPDTISVKDLQMITGSFEELEEQLTLACQTNDSKIFQRINHKFTPSLKMLGVADAFLDLSILRSIQESGNLTESIAFHYHNQITEKIKAWVHQKSGGAYSYKSLGK